MKSIATERVPIATDVADQDQKAMLRDTELEAQASLPLRASVFDSLAAAEADWRSLEARAVLTPYQRFDWARALVASRGVGGRCAIVVIHAADQPVALLPLVVKRRLGVRIASLIGADIGNADWPVLDRKYAARLTAAALVGQLQQVGGIDLLSLTNMPASWLGLAHPFIALPHQPAPDHLYLASIGEDSSLLSSKRIRNIQRGRRRLEEQFGEVVLRRAETAEEFARIHDVFLAQRGARFVEMGVRNIFADDWFVRFFRNAAVAAPGHEPAMRFHALYAGDEIVATACGTYAGAHYAQFINSTASGPAAKYSLMGILMYDLVAELRAGGITSIDLGLGDFEYKTDWTEKAEVYDCAVPLNGAGRLAAPILRGARDLKRRIKQSPVLFERLKRLRAMLNFRG